MPAPFCVAVNVTGWPARATVKPGLTTTPLAEAAVTFTVTEPPVLELEVETAEIVTLPAVAGATNVPPLVPFPEIVPELAVQFTVTSASDWYAVNCAVAPAAMLTVAPLAPG
jgi:hypothetical protein